MLLLSLLQHSTLSFPERLAVPKLSHHSALSLPKWPISLKCMSRRAALSLAGGIPAVILNTPATARPEGVNKPELLPQGSKKNVIDLQNFLTSGEVAKLEKQLSSLESATGVKLRVLCQQYPNSPGLAIKDYWNLDDNSIVMVVDKGTKGTANILNFNVGEGVKLSLPNIFWTRLQSTFGTTFFVKENGEDIAITSAVDTIDYCLRDDLGFCTDVPMLFKNPSKAIYGDEDPVMKMFGAQPGKDFFGGVSSQAEKLFGP